MVYIALLRGINVGGHNRIKMVELKQTLEAMGLQHVQTYIQSGNVLFDSEAEEGELRRRIEHQIGAVFGISVAVVLRTAVELEQIIANCPFSKQDISAAEEASEGESLYVALMPESPSQERIEWLRLSALKGDGDAYRIAGRDIYLLFRQSVRNSKLANSLQKLDIPSTLRNWKTLSKLSALAKAREA